MNPQTLQAVLWVLGVAVTVLLAVISFLVKWNGDQDKRMGEIEKQVAANARHTAENYVRGHEILEVKKMISDLRNEVSHQIGELTKAVYQMVGQVNKN